MHFFIFALVICVPTFVESKHISGVLKSDSDWHFLTKFCFLPVHGSLQFTLKYPRSHQTQSLLFYYDKPGLWNRVYNSNMTCRQKESLLNPDNYQIFRLSPGGNNGSMCRLVAGSVLCVSPIYRFKSMRERWWFLVISNCAAKHGVLMEYDMWLRNGPQGNVFREHFSADEMYLLEACGLVAMLHLALFAAVVAAAARLDRQRMLHSTYKMFAASCLLSLLASVFYCAAYAAYGIGGSRLDWLHWTAESLHALASWSLTLMLVLLSLGLSVTCGSLPACGLALVCSLSACLLLSQAGLIATQAIDAGSDARLRRRWSGWAGYCLLAAAYANCLLYACGCFYSLAIHRRRRRFYAPMSAFFIAWLAAWPAAGAVNATLVPAFMRARVATCVQLALLLAAQAFFLLVSLPVRLNSCAPYKIGVDRLSSITFKAAAHAAGSADADIDDDDLSGGGGGGKVGELTDGTTFTGFSIFTVLDQSRAGARAGRQQQQQQQQQPLQPVSPPRFGCGQHAKLLHQAPVYEEIPEQAAHLVGGVGHTELDEGDDEDADDASDDQGAMTDSDFAFCAGGVKYGRQEPPARPRPSMGVSSLRRWQR